MYNMIVHTCRIRYGNGTQYGVLCTDCTSLVEPLNWKSCVNNSGGKSYRANYALESHCAIINKWCYSKENGIKLQLIANMLRAGAEGDRSFPRDVCCTCMCMRVCVDARVCILKVRYPLINISGM